MAVDLFFIKLFIVRYRKLHNKSAFTLVELSIVLLIVSILLSGALSVSMVGVNNSKNKVTQQRISAIYTALGNYLVKNGRMPCPASIKAIKSSSNDYGNEVGAGASCVGAGVYQSTSNSNLVYGAIPVTALGMAKEFAEDGFEAKFAYIVDVRATKKTVIPTVDTDSFATFPHTGVITVTEKYGNGDSVITNDAIFAIISYGVAKLGAFNVNSADQNPRAADADQQSNDASAFVDSGSPVADFDNNLFSLSTSNEEFDDVVFYKTRNDFVGDFVSLGALALIPCPAITVASCYGTSIAWPQSSYNQLVQATDSCPSSHRAASLHPTRKCLAYGKWQKETTNPCLINGDSSSTDVACLCTDAAKCYDF